MAFELEPRYRALQEEARAVASGVEPFAVEADSSSQLHEGIYKALHESRLWQLLVPGEFGGRFPTIDPLAVCVVREVLMPTSGALDAMFSLQGIGSYSIAVGGSDTQRAEWLPGVARGDVLAALALTEPHAGSDLKAITTELRQNGRGLVLNGRKAFISNAGAAGYYSALAREGDGFTMVLVPADAAGVGVEEIPELAAPHVIGDVVFDNVALDARARIGDPGRGLDLVLATLAVFRVSVAGAACGLAQAALEEAVKHTHDRTAFGRPLARHGEVAAMLADSWTELEMARLLTYRAAEMARDDAAKALPHSSMAKLAATEMAGRVTDRAVQVMGRFALVRDSKVERLYREARPMRLYEGSSEILRLGIARALGELYA
jgi:acyl-CoA dehydrogenase